MDLSEWTAPTHGSAGQSLAAPERFSEVRDDLDRIAHPHRSSGSDINELRGELTGQRHCVNSQCGWQRNDHMMRLPTLIARCNEEIGSDSLHRLAQVDGPRRQLGGESSRQRKRATGDSIRRNVNRIARIAVNAGDVIKECVTESILLECVDTKSPGQCHDAMFARPIPRRTKIQG